MQPQRILEEADYLNPFMPGFKPRYGTETALVALMDDLWQERDGGGTSIFAIFDQSAAFNAINHDILFNQHRKL